MTVRNILFVVLFMGLLMAGVQAQQSCDHCGKDMLGEYLSSSTGSYHPSCYRDHVQPRCDYCKKPIEDNYKILRGKNYHVDCYTDHVLDKCDICRQPLEGLYVTDYWGNSYHKHHDEDANECGTCGRVISKHLSQGGSQLADGRIICGICSETSVTRRTVRASTQYEVRRILERHGIEGLPEDIPLTLVDASTLRNLSGINSEDMRAFTDHRSQTLNGEVITRDSHIYVLSHLPLVVFKAILAHELLHVYLFEHDLELAPDVREGFCNLGSELIYELDGSDLAEFHLRNMQKSQDPDYGVGYRRMSGILNRVGWVRLLEELPTY